MVFKVTIISIAILLGSSFRSHGMLLFQDQNLQPVQQIDSEDGRYFILDPETLNFVEIQKTTGSETSTGLGLYIVKRLVEMMNGNVWCESQCGKGTSFIIEFPTSNQPLEQLESVQTTIHS